MKAKPEKSHLLVSKKTSDNLKIDVNGGKIERGLEQKLLGVIIDDQLTFKNHICNMLKKAGQKLNVLTRTESYMDQKKREIIMSAYMSSQFGYCSLVWMIHNWTMNDKQNI